MDKPFEMEGQSGPAERDPGSGILYEDWCVWLSYLSIALLGDFGPIGLLVAMRITGYEVPWWAVGWLAGWCLGGIPKIRRDLQKACLALAQSQSPEVPSPAVHEKETL